MGYSDEKEKLRQAEEWLAAGTPQQKAAAHDHVLYILATEEGDLRAKANEIVLGHIMEFSQ